MRTPLNSIITLLGVLLEEIKNKKILQTMRIIYSSSRMLKYLVNDMIDLFALKTNRFRK